MALATNELAKVIYERVIIRDLAEYVQLSQKTLLTVYLLLGPIRQRSRKYSPSKLTMLMALLIVFPKRNVNLLPCYLDLSGKQKGWSTRVPKTAGRRASHSKSGTPKHVTALSIHASFP